MTDAITLLGTKGGPAIRPGSSMPTSILVQLAGKTILVDAGLGCTAALTRAGIPLTDLDAVLITHLHSDHYLELGPLLHTAWTAGLKTPLPIHAPEGLDTYWQGFLASMAFDIDTRIADEGRPDLASLAPIHVLDDTSHLRLGDLTVTTLRNHHPPIKDSFALKLTGADKTVVLSGDTAPLPEMVDFARDADLLVHEAMLIPGVQKIVDRMGYKDDRLLKHILRSHTPAEEAARIAQQATVKALALNHLIPADDPEVTEKDWLHATEPHYSGKIHIGRDGMKIPL
ncbi:MBL fold metallo-hydrolase [Roseovarius sp. A21]|uniref:MBL fold metallo-hydrolase n=1 Tax=Roseovarius bejariae TaxID=2576383 RepID=A0A844CZ25_9RHOB|nr:MBL fold metallo-hydrolase [Roseovarius bejariae]MRU14883.1 MBL fold metallo-hydrolase [Roseovarius bejariae]